MGLITREAALSTNAFRKVKIDVSEWTPGEESFVWVRELSAREKDDFERSLMRRTGRKTEVSTENVRAKLAVLCCCDENGARIFQDEDVAALTTRPAGVLSKIYEAAQKINEVDDEDVDELVKNSSTITKRDSGSN